MRYRSPRGSRSSFAPPSLWPRVRDIRPAFTSITNHPLTILASTLVTLLPTLWYTPYRAVTLAGFYDARLRAPQPDDQPMMPPL